MNPGEEDKSSIYTLALERIRGAQWTSHFYCRRSSRERAQLPAQRNIAVSTCSRLSINTCVDGYVSSVSHRSQFHACWLNYPWNKTCLGNLTIKESQSNANTAIMYMSLQLFQLFILSAYFYMYHETVSVKQSVAYARPWNMNTKAECWCKK